VAIDLFVSPSGDDAAAGTETRPFASLTRARDAIRTLKRSGGLGSPLTVRLRGGEYPLTETLVLGTEDSGTAACPITWAAYPGETPVLTGGRRLQGWRRGERGAWELDLPEVSSGSWYFRSLWVNGVRRRRARLPEEGLYQVAGLLDQAPAGGLDPYAGSADRELKRSAFRYAPGQVDPRWRTLSDVEIVVLQHWADSRMKIERVDEKHRVVVFTERAFRPLDWCLGWYAENVAEGLTAPGMWYLDRSSGTLRYLPLPGEDMATTEVVAPVVDTWLRLEGDWRGDRPVEWISFRGLSFRHCGWSLEGRAGYSYPQTAMELTPGELLWATYPAEGLSIPQSQVRAARGIDLEGVHHVALEDCEVAHTGGWGMVLHLGCQDNRIVGNHFHDLGAGAVRLGGADFTLDDREESCRTEITDNHIHDGCAVYQGSSAVALLQSGGNRIAHNEIHGWFEWATSAGWQWEYWPPGRARNNVFEWNHVHDLGGGFFGPHATLYFLGISPGTVVRNNLLAHIARDGAGIYLDASASGILVENNVVWDFGSGGLGFNFSNTGNVLTNNIVAFGRAIQLDRCGDQPWAGASVGQSGIVYRNIVCFAQGTMWRGEKWLNHDMLLDYNVYWRTDGEEPRFLTHDVAAWQALGHDRHSVIADPLFVDAEHGDFRLRPGSPAVALGFRGVDLSRVGPRPPAERD
jgi:hypothetical protein